MVLRALERAGPPKVGKSIGNDSERTEVKEAPRLQQ